MLKRTTILLSIIFSLFSCKQNLIDGPSVQYTDTYGWTDSVEEDDVVHISFEAVAGNTFIKKATIFSDDIIIFDTLLETPLESFGTSYEYSFLNNGGLKTITIQAFDKNDLYAEKSRNLYVHSLNAPRIEFVAPGIINDTTTIPNNLVGLTVQAVRTDRDIDSIYVYANDSILATYKITEPDYIQDTIKEKLSYSTDTVGVYNIKAKVIDVIKKSSSTQFKIIVVTPIEEE